MKLLYHRGVEQSREVSFSRWRHADPLADILYSWKILHSEALVITTHFSLEVNLVLITSICNLISIDSLVNVANVSARGPYPGLLWARLLEIPPTEASTLCIQQTPTICIALWLAATVAACCAVDYRWHSQVNMRDIHLLIQFLFSANSAELSKSN